VLEDANGESIWIYERFKGSTHGIVQFIEGSHMLVFKENALILKTE